MEVIVIVAMRFSSHVRDSGGDGPALIWLKEWGILDHEFEQAMLERFRLSFGQPSALHVTPGYLFDHSEHNLLNAVWVLAFIGAWDAYLVPTHGRYLIELSHDGLVIATFAAAREADEMAAYFANIKGVTIRCENDVI